MSQLRNTRATRATPLSESFLAVTRPTSSNNQGSTSANPPDRSPSTVSENVLQPANEGEEGNEPGDENPDPDPKTSPDPDLNPNNRNEAGTQPDHSLAGSLKLLAEKISSISAHPKPKSNIKPRTPDVFDGTDPSKVDTFTFQCSMYYNACSSDFPDEESRVTFALSYLKGVPLDWFQAELSRAINDGDDYPEWYFSYSDFVAELQKNFGPRDPVADATNALEALRYKESTKAARYTIEFNRHAHRTGWNDMALTRQYYKGLPERLKDEISRIGKPGTLKPLQELVATLDQRYWERQSEINRDKRSASASNNSTSQNKSTSSDNRNDNRSGNQNASGSRNNNNNNNQQSKNKEQKKPASNANASSSSSGNKANTIADLLGPDGKLKPEERQRRMDQNLCLRCGKPGHTVNNCTVPSKAKPKGRAATVTPSTATPAAGTTTGSGKA